MEKTIYYDLVLDETGKFLRKEAARERTTTDIDTTLHSAGKEHTSAKEKKFDSANVGFLLKSEKGFLLTDENGSLKIDDKKLKTAFSNWYDTVSIQCKDGLSLKDFMHISEFGASGCKLASDKRTEVQAKMLEKYKASLDNFDSNWELVAFEQNKEELSNAIEDGEAAALAYSKTLFDGLADLVVQKYMDNYPNEVSFHIGIATRLYFKIKFSEDGSTGDRKPAVIPIRQFRTMFMNHVSKEYGEAVKKLCEKVCWFYSINAIEKPIWNNSAKLKELCVAYKSDAANKNDRRKIVMQFLLTIADCLANGYRHKDEKQKAFFESMAARTYKVGHLTGKKRAKEWKIRKDILKADCEEMLKNMILFPSVGVAQDVSWEELYGKVQEKFKPFIDKFLVHEMLNMEPKKAEGLVGKISVIVQTDLRSRTNEREEKKRWIARLNSLLSLHKALVKRKEKDRAANLLGADAYLFLAHLYQNFGMDNEANTMLDNAEKLSDYWDLERDSVYTLLRLNKLNDKFQANEVKETYKNYLETMRRYRCSMWGSEKRYTRDVRDNIAKINSIYIESLLIQTCAVNVSNAKEDIKEKTKKAIESNSKKALATVKECFPGWSDRQYAYSHYFRLNVALGKMRVASAVFLASLREIFDVENGGFNQKGNCSVGSAIRTQNVPDISLNDFFELFTREDETQEEAFRAFVYLNFLTLFRVQLQEEKWEEINYFSRVFTAVEPIRENQIRDLPVSDLVKKGKSSNIKISSEIQKNERGIYPACLIYWRLAQIYRYQNIDSAEDYPALSRWYYKKALELLENKTYLRLLAIKIAILADYADFLGDDDTEKSEKITELKNAYAIFEAGCIAVGDVRNIFAHLFSTKNVSENLGKIARAVQDYY